MKNLEQDLISLIEKKDSFITTLDPTSKIYKAVSTEKRVLQNALFRLKEQTKVISEFSFLAQEDKKENTNLQIEISKLEHLKDNEQHYNDILYACGIIRSQERYSRFWELIETILEKPRRIIQAHESLIAVDKQLEELYNKLTPVQKQIFNQVYGR